MHLQYLPTAAALLALASNVNAACTQWRTSTVQGECTGGAQTITVTSTVTVGGPTDSTTTSTPTSSTTTTTGTVIIGPTGGVDKLIGYGQGTTGGGSGAGTTVTSCSALSAALPKGGVIYINGILSGCGVLKMVSGTSVIGVGANSGMTKGGLAARGQSNIIVRNLKLSSAVGGGDLLAFDSTKKVWIDHNELFNGGLVGGKDDYDGLLDITHGCDDITVSWNKFHDHWKGSLVGHSDSNAGEDRGAMKVTYHHNEWYNVNSRLPSLRFGTGHIYSSCFAQSPTSGINSRMGAVVLVEGNSFTDVKLAIVTDLDSDEAGSAQERNNLFLGTTTTRITKTGTLSPPYSYTVDDVSGICALVKSKAGTGVVA